VRNIKIILEYNGSEFAGFQKQPKRSTIQGCLEKAMARLFNRPVKINAASGRTDAGVHAKGQVVNFKVETVLSLYQIQRGLNRYLPPSISVMKAEEVSEEFNARFDVKSKIYEYRIWNFPVRSPLWAAISYHVPMKLDVVRMRRAARMLTGKIDFASFCGADAKRRKGDFFRTKGNTIRTVKRIEIKKKGRLLCFVVEGDGFLNHMVRNMAGMLLDIGRGARDTGEIPGILRGRNRRLAGSAAPACGLTLASVTY
jgi:tRNA pseudouridine38-40 synthase